MDLIGYLSNGYPSEKETIDRAAAYIEGGCDVIEIDLPSNNPYIDGEMIQTRMKASYQNDPSLQSQAQTIKEIRSRFPSQRLFVLVYEETVIKFGLEAFIQLQKDCHTEAVILIAPSNDTVKKELEKNGIKVASYIRFHLPEEDILQAKDASGFIYLEATPSQAPKAGFETLEKVIGYLRQELGTTRPIHCGVGISTLADVKMVKEAGADGVFVGSTILRIEDDKKELVDWLKLLKRETV